MTCHNCRIEMVMAGFYGKNRVQRFKRQQCGKRWSMPQEKPFGADVRLALEKVQMILHFVEGNSVRGTARLCDVEKRTVLNILKLAGKACERLFTEKVREVRVSDLEFDELWTFVGFKQKRLTPERFAKGMRGDAYAFIGLERTSKLVVAWHPGKRDRINTEDFVSKVRGATANLPFDVSTDGFEAYENAIDAGLYDRANHSSVVKVFSNTAKVIPDSYRPAKFIAVQKDAVSGEPDLDRAGTSHVERKNGTVRQWCKRFTRLTYAFSKRWDDLKAALALQLRTLQFLSSAWIAEQADARDGRWHNGSHLGSVGADGSIEPNHQNHEKDGRSLSIRPSNRMKTIAYKLLKIKTQLDTIEAWKRSCASSSMRRKPHKRRLDSCASLAVGSIT